MIISILYGNRDADTTVHFARHVVRSAATDGVMAGGMTGGETDGKIGGTTDGMIGAKNVERIVERTDEKNGGTTEEIIVVMTGDGRDGRCDQSER